MGAGLLVVIGLCGAVLVWAARKWSREHPNEPFTTTDHRTDVLSRAWLGGGADPGNLDFYFPTQREDGGRGR